MGRAFLKRTKHKLTLLCNNVHSLFLYALKGGEFRVLSIDVLLDSCCNGLKMCRSPILREKSTNKSLTQFYLSNECTLSSHSHSHLIFRVKKIRKASLALLRGCHIWKL